MFHTRRRLATIFPCLLVLLFPDAAAAFAAFTTPSSFSIRSAPLAQRHPSCHGQAARRLASAQSPTRSLVAALLPEAAAVVGEEFRGGAGRAGLEVRRAGPEEVKQLAWLVVSAFEERMQEAKERVEGANQINCLPCTHHILPLSLSLPPSPSLPSSL